MEINEQLNGWNDATKTEIPLNTEIFILTKDELNPHVAICRMTDAKKVTWSVSKEGQVLCYDIPCGNFHSCNGNAIKYWKHIDKPINMNKQIRDAIEVLMKIPEPERYKLIFGKELAKDIKEAKDQEEFLKCKETIRKAVHDYIKITGHDLKDSEKLSIKNISELF